MKTFKIRERSRKIKLVILQAPSVPVDFLDNIKSCRLQKGAANIKEFKFNKKRARVVTECEEFPDECAGIVYWMSRDQRVQGERFKSLI